MPTVESVQTGRARDVGSGRYTTFSAIDKQPRDSIVVHVDGVDGDAIVTTKHHGGPGQAVYVYTREDYAHFSRMLGLALPAGSFGENVTLDALPSPVRIGDRLHMGEVVLEISAPRVPCSTFAARMAEIGGPDTAKGWVARFTAERRPGWYARVIAEGVLTAGLRVDVEPAPDDAITGLEVWDLYHDRSPDPALLARALEAPLAERTRELWTSAPEESS